jgi:glycosyltransferase involved in cell wall biosynthesis
MKATPTARVGVCIPTRNRAHYLREAIDSVLAQSFQDFVLVVSDNASTDGTRQLVESIPDPRVIYSRLDEDIGLVANHNRCFDLVSSEYVLLLPDDDILRPGMLEQAVEVLDRHPRVGFVHSAFDMIGPAGDVRLRGVSFMSGAVQDTYESGRDYIRNAMDVSIRVHVSTTLFRRAALPRVRFDPQDHPPVDLALMLRIALNWDVYWIARAQAALRLHTDSFSANNGGSYTDTGYIETADYIAKVTEIKLRFLDTDGRPLPEAPLLRKRALWTNTFLLVNMIGRRTIPERRFTPTLRLLVDAWRQDRRIAWDRGAWRLLVASVLGPRLVEWLKGFRSAKRLRAEAGW